TSRVRQVAVGDFLGEPAAATDGTLEAYVRRAGLGGLGLLEALRRLLSLFRLPGEAQKIARILEAFAQQHARTGADAAEFGHADGVYVLCYSIVLLNVDLHNPNVKKRMTPDDFVRANRGINDGADFGEGLLRRVYESISGEQLRLAE
ncbi:Sec7 domain-containing protein, partial [Pavlovales sp. CCMP2436]